MIAFVVGKGKPKAGLDLLAPYLESPEKISVTIQIGGFLKEDDVRAVNLPGRITQIWIGTDTSGKKTGGQQRVKDGQSLLDAWRESQKTFEEIAEIKERTKPNPDIVIPHAQDYGIYSFRIEGTAKEILEVNEQIPRAIIIDVSKPGKPGPNPQPREQF